MDLVALALLLLLRLLSYWLRCSMYACVPLAATCRLPAQLADAFQVMQYLSGEKTLLVCWEVL